MSKKTTITRNKRPLTELGKHTHVPYTIEDLCPKCKAKCKANLDGDHSLSYPVIGKPSKVYFYHECKDGSVAEWQVKVVLRMTLELA